MKLRSDGRLLRVGHKGAAALAPENTLESLERAVELGCDLVEFDVLDLHDGTLVLAHSDDLWEVSHGSARGRVRGLMLDELRAVAPGLLALRRALPLRIGRLLDRAGASVAMLYYGVVTRAAVRRCHARDAAVFAWTVDSPGVLQRMARAGVDGVITNDPRIFRG